MSRGLGPVGQRSGVRRGRRSDMNGLTRCETRATTTRGAAGEFTARATTVRTRRETVRVISVEISESGSVASRSSYLVVSNTPAPNPLRAAPSRRIAQSCQQAERSPSAIATRSAGVVKGNANSSMRLTSSATIARCNPSGRYDLRETSRD